MKGLEDGGKGGGNWEGEYRDGEAVGVQSEVGFIVRLFLFCGGCLRGWHTGCGGP